jgi:hypothetical protein
LPHIQAAAYLIRGIQVDPLEVNGQVDLFLLGEFLMVGSSDEIRNALGALEVPLITLKDHLTELRILLLLSVL